MLRIIVAPPMVAIAKKSLRSLKVGRPIIKANNPPANAPANHPIRMGNSNPNIWLSNLLGGGSVRSALV